MKKAVELIKPVRHETPENIKNIKNFIELASIALIYSPDRKGSIQYLLDPSYDMSIISKSAILSNNLYNEFFSDIYIDRHERFDIEGAIPIQHLYLIYGPVGVGKTILILRVIRSLLDTKVIKPIYIDCKASEVSDYPDNEFKISFINYLFNELKKEYIDNDDNEIENWIIYKIKEDEAYSETRELIQTLYRKSLEGKEWLFLLEADDIRETLIRASKKPLLFTLLRYLRGKYPLALFIDNVDRFPLSQQSIVLEICLDLSNHANIPIVIAFRSANIRRITKVGSNGDIVFLDNLDSIQAKAYKINYKREDDFLGEKKGSLIAKIIERRLNYIKRAGSTKGGLTEEIQKLYDDLDQGTRDNLPFSDYNRLFWQLLQEISNTFVEEGMVAYCNSNIRQTLILCTQFINLILLNAEPGYRLRKILSFKNGVRITPLRNLFYKWLIYRGRTTITKEMVNILENCKTKPYLLEIKLLAYLKNNFGTELSANVGQILQDFWRLGIDRVIVLDIIYRLSQNQEENENSYIWLEKERSSPIEDAKVYLMPAGIFFLEKLGASREYIFWMIMNLDLQEEAYSYIFENRNLIDQKLTWNDKFKLITIERYIENEMLPLVNAEYEDLDKKINLPASWKDTAYRFYQKNFGVRGSCYIEYMINSVMNTIDHATGLSSDERKGFISRFGILLHECRKYELHMP